MDEDNAKGKTYHFEWKDPKDHLIGILCGWKHIILSSLAAFGVIWGIVESTVLLRGDTPQTVLGYGIMVFTSILIGVWIRIHAYLNTKLPELVGYSDRCSRLAHLRPERWEFKLAQQMMVERIAPLDQQYKRVRAGEVFIPLIRSFKETEFANEMRIRFASFQRMADVLSSNVLGKLSESLASKLDPTDKLRAIVEAMVWRGELGRGIVFRLFGGIVCFLRGIVSLWRGGALKL